MADKTKYIAQYRKPLGIDNPPINLPTPNKPEEVFLTEGQAKVVRDIVPDIKLVKAGKENKEKEEPAQEEVEEQAEEEAKEEEKQAEQEGSEEPEETEDEDDANLGEEDTSDEQEGPYLLVDDEDFPGADKLLEAEINTVEEVVERWDSLTDVDGIGNKRADSIQEHIKENYAQLLSEDE